MKLIVGLGNPGEQYDNTRHNIGFHVLDHLLEDTTKLDKTFWEKEKDVKGLIKKVMIEGVETVLLKPQTFMNLSGESVALALKKYNGEPSDLFIVYDDLDLPLGKLRIRMGGAAGGHRGVESLIASLKTDTFLRVRIGIGRPVNTKFKVQSSKFKIDEYVIAPFTPSEKSKVRTATKEVIKTLKILLKDGIDVYMSKYNKK